MKDIRMFNNNLAFSVDRHESARFLNIFLKKKYHIFFEFDPDFSTIKWVPKFQKRCPKGKNMVMYRVMFMLFSCGFGVYDI